MSFPATVYGLGSSVLSNIFVSLPEPSGDLRHQTVIVTGSNTGLGFEASRHLLRLGVEKLIMGVRTPQKGETAKRELLTSTKREESSIEVWPLDMDSYASVKQFAARAAGLPRLDALVANAGIATKAFSITEDNEKTITTNVVSTLLLCMLLLPKLRESSDKFGNLPKIVIPNSALHYLAPVKELDVKDGEIFATLNGQKTADMASRYPLSKLLIIYAIRELELRMSRSQKSVVVINTPNPSWCKSQLTQEDSLGVRIGEKMLGRTTEVGSRAIVNGVLSGVESNGKYLTNCHVQT